MNRSLRTLFFVLLPLLACCVGVALVPGTRADAAEYQPVVDLKIMYPKDGPPCLKLTRRERLVLHKTVDRHHELLKSVVVHVSRKCAGPRMFSRVGAKLHAAFVTLKLKNDSIIESRWQTAPRRSIVHSLKRKIEHCVKYYRDRYTGPDSRDTGGLRLVDI